MTIVLTEANESRFWEKVAIPVTHTTIGTIVRRESWT